MKNILAIGTDGEEALFDGMHNNMNHAIHLRCFGHFRDNCKRKLQESGVTEEAQKEFLSDVFGRHHGDIFEKGNVTNLTRLYFTNVPSLHKWSPGLRCDKQPRSITVLTLEGKFKGWVLIQGNTFCR